MGLSRWTGKPPDALLPSKPVGTSLCPYRVAALTADSCAERNGKLRVTAGEASSKCAGAASSSPQPGRHAAAELLQGLMGDLGELEGGLRQVHQH